MRWLEAWTLHREWRRLKRRECHLERINCPILASQVRAASERVRALINQNEGLK